MRPFKGLTILVAAAALATSASIPGQATGAVQPLGPGANSQRLTLITGEQIEQRIDAAGRESLLSVSGPAPPPLLTYNLGSHSYVLPALAARFVAHGLDPALFDTQELAGAETLGVVPVIVTWHGSTRPSMPWLMNSNDSRRGSTSGEITATSGLQLQQDLAAQPRTSTNVWSGSLRGIDSIMLAASHPAPSASPRFNMRTLTVKGVDATGGPDTGDSATVLNTDFAPKFIGFASWNKGILKLSVPDGHYSAAGTFFSFSQSRASIELVVINFTVRGNTVVTIDARTATSRIRVSTPRVAPNGSGTAEWQRNSAAGGGVGVGVGWSFGAGQPQTDVFVNPTPAPRVGTQSWIVSYHLDSPPSSHPYTYDLAFESVGAIPADQHYTATPSQLATVDTRYYSDVADRTTGEGRISFFPDQTFGFGTFDVFAAPLRRTEYVSARPELVWQQQVIDSIFTFGGAFFDSGNVFLPGQTTTADWGRGPQGPGTPEPTGGATPLQACPACIEANTLEFEIFPFGDNPSGHFGPPNFPSPDVTESDTFDLLRNGSTIASGQDPLGLAVPVPAGAARYQLGYDVAMSAPWWTLSTSTSTQWTFREPRSMQGVPPAGWACFSGSTFGCNVIDLMLPDYQLHENLTNQVAGGPTRFELGIQHVLGVSVGAVRATVSVSFDGGVVWSSASVSQTRNGEFSVSYTNPPGAGTGSLRIHVVDANGDALDQTVLNAYAIS
jgi:hypothetical protein